MKKVAILMGSVCDQNVMQTAADVLDIFGIPNEMHVMSVHRDHHKVVAFMKTAEENGMVCVIAGAGMAAYLPGVVAALTTMPVIGVPLDPSLLGGADALYSIVQMTPGVPVVTVVIGKAGAKNAGVLAAQIPVFQEPVLREKLVKFREEGIRISK